MRRSPAPAAVPLFLTLVTLSGFSAITYELLWLRRLNLVLGSDSYALAITLASFMAGLGLGSWFFGRLADRLRPLAVYRWLELGIGAFALASPALFSAGALPYRLLFRELGGHGALFLASKFAVAFVVLLLPTFLMGGTLPAAARVLTRAFEARGRSLALVYGMNTLGAAVASVVVPFGLMPRFDLSGILWLAAAGNGAIFLGSFLLPGEAAPTPAEGRAPRGGTEPPGRLLLATVFLSGFVSLALETVWNRLFSVFFTSSTYTFGLILVLYLVPVALGSLLATGRRVQSLRPGAVFAWCQFGIALGILANLLWMDRAPLLQLALWDHFLPGFGTYVFASALVMALFTAGINFLFGLSFPSALAYLTTSFSALGAQTGRLAALNTAGTSLASLVVTFALYGTLGSRLTLALLALLALACFALLAPRLRLGGWRACLAGGAAAVLLAGLAFPWDLKNFHLTLCQRPDWVLKTAREGGLEGYKRDIAILDFREDEEAVVSVARDIPSGGRHLFINGKPDASDFAFDMPTQVLLGYLPFLYHSAREPEEVFVIGLGSGVTTYAASCQSPRKLLTAEISPGVVRAARQHFADANGGVLERYPVILEDGRNYLQNTSESFDILISEPTNPWITGISNLYTREFFETAKARLKPGGIFCQWLQYYRMDLEQIRGVVATLRATFPHLNAYTTRGDLILLASDRELSLDPERLYRPPPGARALLQKIQVSPPEAVLSQLLWDSGQAAAVRSLYPPNRDDRNWLEWDAPRSMVLDASERNLAELLSGLGEPRAPLRLAAGATGGTWDFPEMGLTAGPFASGPPALADYGVVKRVYRLPDQLIENAFYSARFTWGEGETFSVSSPVLEGPIEEKDVLALLKHLQPTLPGTGPMSFDQDGVTHLALADLSGPLRWTGFWTSPVSNRTYLLTLESSRRVRGEKELAQFLRAFRCHR